MARAPVGIFSADQVALMKKQHVLRTLLGWFDFSFGEKRLHIGTGTLTTLDGNKWLGVSSEDGSRFVQCGVIQPVRDVENGAKTTVTLSGVNKGFLKTVYDNKEAEAGRSCQLYWQSYDPQTKKLYGNPIPLIANAKMCAPETSKNNQGVISVTVAIEGVFAGGAFAPGFKYTAASQELLYPEAVWGERDTGCDFCGTKQKVAWPPS